MIKLEEISYKDEVVLTIEMDEKDSSLVLTDKNNNSIRMGSKGLIFYSEQDITLSVKGSVHIQGKDINVHADIALTATGNATATLSASGETSVKGAMVKIN